MLSDKLLQTIASALLFFALLSFSLVGKTESYPEFPYSKKMNVVIAANDIEYNGIPTRIFQFDTEMPMQEVEGFYSKQWDDIDRVEMADRVVLSHREGDYLLTVQIEINSHPTTHGILVVSPVFKLLEGRKSKIAKLKKSVGKDFPALPNTVFISDIKGKEVVGDSRSLHFLNDYDIRRNMEFYSQKMVSEGWVPIGNRGIAEEQGVLAMNRNGRKFNLSFTRKDGKTHGIAVFLP